MLTRVADYPSRLMVAFAFRHLFIVDASGEEIRFPQEVIQLIARHTDDLYLKCPVCSDLLEPHKYAQHKQTHIQDYPSSARYSNAAFFGWMCRNGE